MPMTRDMKLTREEQRTPKQQAYVDSFPYEELLGSLLFLAVNTRPDIAFAVNACARYSNSPLMLHVVPLYKFLTMYLIRMM
jgi:hypothetical protein